VVSAASNVVLKVAVNPATGAPTVLSDPADSTRVLEIPVGRNPRGIVVNWRDTRAYVMNYISRDVTVIDLTGTREQVTATLASASLPTPGTPEDLVHIGKELYNTSIGVFDPASAGLAFRAVRADQLSAAAGGTDFSELFGAFSFFLLAAAVMLVAMLFRLSVEQRSRQLGLLAAAGLAFGIATPLLHHWIK
jgi:hypothetical protein